MIPFRFNSFLYLLSTSLALVQRDVLLFSESGRGCGVLSASSLVLLSFYVHTRSSIQI